MSSKYITTKIAKTITILQCKLFIVVKCLEASVARTALYRERDGGFCPIFEPIKISPTQLQMAPNRITTMSNYFPNANFRYLAC